MTRLLSIFLLLIANNASSTSCYGMKIGSYTGYDGKKYEIRVPKSEYDKSPAWYEDTPPPLSASDAITKALQWAKNKDEKLSLHYLIINKMECGQLEGQWLYHISLRRLGQEIENDAPSIMIVMLMSGAIIEGKARQ